MTIRDLIVANPLATDAEIVVLATKEVLTHRVDPITFSGLSGDDRKPTWGRRKTAEFMSKLQARATPATGQAPTEEQQDAAFMYNTMNGVGLRPTDPGTAELFQAQRTANIVSATQVKAAIHHISYVVASDVTAQQVATQRAALVREQQIRFVIDWVDRARNAYINDVANVALADPTKPVPSIAEFKTFVTSRPE